MHIDRKAILSLAALAVAGALVVTHFDEIASLVGTILHAVAPFAIGAAFAYLINLLMTRWECILFPKSTRTHAARVRRPLAIALSLLTIFGIIGLIVGVAADALVESFGALKAGVTNLFSWLAPHILANETVQEFLKYSPEDWMTLAQDMLANLGGIEAVADPIAGAAMAIGSGAVELVIAFIFSIYLLMSKERCLNGARTCMDMLIPARIRGGVDHVLSVTNDCFSKFIVGQCTEALVLGSLCAIGLLIFNFPHAIAVAFCVGATAIVPIFGAWIGGIVGALMIFSVSPIKAVWFVVFLLVLQQIEGHLIYPFVVGSSMGVPSLWILVAVVVGSALMGLPGLILGVPLVATLRTLAIEAADAWRARNNKELVRT